ncbi:MAG TPA: hypothetical protein VKU19_02585 [Bryobacteraceae bacterium]|nr:hypothetical protein [Bryobacteraceae bacterium]
MSGESRRAAWWADPAAVVSLTVLNLAVCWRLFSAEYTNHFDSIEGSFIAIARYLSTHWGDFWWFPLWHCGMPYQDTYVPLFHLVVAVTTMLGHLSAARAYHAVTGVTYALGPATLYLLAARLGVHRGAAFLAALFYSLFSPSTLLMPDIARDVGGFWYSRRLQVLTMYGEGPHVTAMTLLPIAILALQRALEKHSGRALALAAGTIALVFLTNVPGTMALALTVFCWICAQPAGMLRRAWEVAAAASIFAYGLACYGLPPSSLGTVFGNAGPMHPGFSRSLRYGPVLLILVFLVVAGVGYLLARTRATLPVRFAILQLGLIAALAIKANSLTFELLPQVGRLHLEMEMGACLLLGMALWQIYTLIPRWIRPIVCALALAPAGIQFANYRWRAEIDISYADVTKRSEYTTARWLDANLPGRRVYVAGSTSFWLNAFTDTPQLVGCCEQGQANPLLVELPFLIDYGVEQRYTEQSVAWLRAFGVQAMVVNGDTSTDVYKDIHSPERFAAYFPILHRENGDTIYRVLPEDASLAHIVRAGEPVPIGAPHVAGMNPSPYVAAISGQSRAPASFEWTRGDTARIRTTIHRGDLVSVQLPWFRGWKASINGQRQIIERDGLGFLVIHPQCQGDCEIALRWTGPPDLPFAALISLASLAYAIWLMLAKYKVSLIPHNEPRA